MDFESDIKAAVAALHAGGVILYPTDTVWGIGCDATNEMAVQKVIALKQRPLTKSMIVMLADARDVLNYVAAPPPDILAFIESFERPTTVVFDGALHLAESVIAEDGSVGIRVTSDAFCKALIRRFRKPVISTSANVSGYNTPQIFSEISSEIVIGADYVVQYRQDDETRHSPSRIVRLDARGTVIILRN